MQVPANASDGELPVEPGHFVNLYNKVSDSETETSEKKPSCDDDLDDKPKTLLLTVSSACVATLIVIAVANEVVDLHCRWYLTLWVQSFNQSINQSINHGFLEWPKYLKHC